MKKDVKEQIDYGNYPERMHPRTERKLGDPEQNVFGASPAMPRGSQDVEKLGSDRFKKVVDKLRDAIHQPNLTSAVVQDMIQREFMSSVMRAKSIELQFTDRLEALAVKAALKVTETPEGKYNINAKLMSGAGEIGNEEFKFEPQPKPEQPGGEEEGEQDFDINTLTKEEKFQLEVHKRNIINALMAGSAKKGHYIFQDPEIKDELDHMNPQLYNYYLKVMAINDYFYFIMEDMIEQMSGSGEGIEGREDIDSDEDEKFDINAKGLLFPILCHEVIKGIEEALGKFGYSDNPIMATDVLGQTDTLPNEAMALRIGPELVDNLRQVFPNELFDETNFGIRPFFIMTLYQIPATDFLKVIRDSISQNERDRTNAKNRFKQIFDKAKGAKERYEQKQRPKNQPPPENMDDFLKSLGIGMPPQN